MNDYLASNAFYAAIYSDLSPLDGIKPKFPYSIGFLVEGRNDHLPVTKGPPSNKPDEAGRFAVINHRAELVSQDRFQSFGSIAQEWFTDDETPVYRGPVPDLWSSACYLLGVPEARDYNAMTWVEEAPPINSEPWESAVRRYCEHDVRLTTPIKHPRGGF